MFPKNLIPLILMPLFLLCFPLSGQSEYPAAPRDTGIPPEPSGFLLTLGPEYRLLAESSQLRLFYREDRGIFAVADRRGGYVWKSGLDIPFNRDVEERLDEGADPLGLPPLEERLNTTFTGIANSIIAVEYYDRANNIRREGSSARENVRLSLSVIQNDPFLADLTVLFDELDLKITLRVELSGNRLLLRAEPEDIQGSGSGRLASIAVAPFMGASGGRRLLWDTLEEDWEISEPKEAPTGYAVVPDGSGALIRFQDNSTELSAYIGDVFGEDPSQAESFRRFADASVPHKTAHMPLFGMVHGSLQNAFAAFAASGGEYMEIAAVPEENTTFYTRAYPRFIYNRLYYQVYNQKGDGYFRLLEEPNRFTLEMHYEFLAGDGENGHRADYTGIARSYRDYLRRTGGLPSPGGRQTQGRETKKDGADIPLRIDFLMADLREGVLGHRHEVTTTIEQVESILGEIQAAGISELSVGLLGYARGGTALSRPGGVRLLKAAAGRDFNRIIASLTARGIDVSLGRDFALIAAGKAEGMSAGGARGGLSPRRNAVRGAGGRYIEYITYEPNAPVSRYYFARAPRIAGWLESESRDMASLGMSSITVDGIGSSLTSDYAGDEPLTVTEVIQHYRTMLAAIPGETGINLVRPNQYLWAYTDRFLDAPLFSTQLLIETDTVPLLQMVLHAAVELFAPYANFSFSSDEDLLRMIDYNVYPSFLLTGESAHLLLMTNSSEYYSTEYRLYRDRIPELYSRVNSVLREVIGAEWLVRDVLAPGVIRNRYDNGADILINYTASPYDYQGRMIGARSALALKAAGGRDGGKRP